MLAHDLVPLEIHRQAIVGKGRRKSRRIDFCRLPLRARPTQPCSPLSGHVANAAGTNIVSSRRTTARIGDAVEGRRDSLTVAKHQP